MRDGDNGVGDADGRALVVLHTFHDAPTHVEIPVEGFPAEARIVSTFHRPGPEISYADGTLTVTGLVDFDGVAVLLDKE